MGFIVKKLKKILKIIGPGFITGASDDDPSGIATYAQTGAIFGYSQLWTALFTYPFTTVIQEMCGRIGIVSGKGLARIIKDYYPKYLLYAAVFILSIANTINLGADLGAMASSAQLIFDLPFSVWLIIFTVLILSLEIYIPYKKYSNILKFLTISLFAYFLVALTINLDWKYIFYSTIIPTLSLNPTFILNLVAILGTTISPYLFFWETDEEVEEEIVHHKIISMGHGKPKITKSDMNNMKLDNIFGMFFSNLVMFFIILTTGTTLANNGINSINSAHEAALALKPIAGEFAFILFALGIIGTGLLAVPILSGSVAYAISESLNWKVGLSEKFAKAHKFYFVIIVSTLIGLVVNFTPIKPFQLLYYTAVLNGISAPPLLFIILLIANNKKIMGRYTNNKFSNIFGTIITIIMGSASLYLFYQILQNYL